MILHVNYEEVTALRQGARSYLQASVEGECAVAAPPAARAEVEALEERLAGDLGIVTLEEQRALATAVAAIVECLRAEMEIRVLEAHPAQETAVAAYFDFGHALAVLGRLRDLGHEMEAMIEVMTGRPVDLRSAAEVRFPD